MVSMKFGKDTKHVVLSEDENSSVWKVQTFKYMLSLGLRQPGHIWFRKWTTSSIKYGLCTVAASLVTPKCPKNLTSWIPLHWNAHKPHADIACLILHFKVRVFNFTHHHSHVHFAIHRSHTAVNHLVVLTWD